MSLLTACECDIAEDAKAVKSELTNDGCTF